MSRFKSFSVPEEAFENFQAASIHKQMDLNTHNMSITIPACASNVEISSTIEDEIQSVNSTPICQNTTPMEPSKRCLEHESRNMLENITIDSTMKDQQVSTTQESSETVYEEEGLQENLQNQVLLETNLRPRRSRRRPPKRKVGRPKQQTLLNKNQENNTLPSDKDETTEEILVTENYAMTENQVVDSTTSQIPNETNIKHNNEQQQKPTEIKINREVDDVYRKPENVTNSNSEEAKSDIRHSNDSLNKIDNNVDTLEVNKDNIAPDCVEAKDDSKSDDDPDEISLSKLKKTLSELDNDTALEKSEDTDLQNLIEIKVIKTNKNTKKRSSKMPIMSDFVYNINSTDSEKTVAMQTDEPTLIDTTSVESSSGRPQRKRGKVNLHYDEDSDEDPFANVESDDDSEPRKSKKSKKYYSDDEYVPDEKSEKKLSTDSDIEKDEEELKKPKKKRSGKILKKKQKNSETILDSSQTIDLSLTHDESNKKDENGMELSTTNSHVKKSNSSSNSWGNTNEFENFLAKRIQGTNLKIKRVTNKDNSAITHLEIPVINSYTKTADVYSQTNTIKLSTTAVQTTSHFEVQMDKNIPLTAIQAEKACAILTDMVKATSNLGELMTQKSDDFIQKKINTSNVTDTIKMDHYVKKSLLLFKLAKDSIMDIEENLASKYEDFLKEHKLSQYTSVPKVLTPTVALKDNDSDCEIVEETLDHKKQNVKGKHQSKFNLKTVFLNKELSIKIAKKPNEEQNIRNKINIKGKNSVWISDSVLVKKVKPTQSFLAQDSRNKKPPDTYVTNEMVSDFFKKYYHASALSTCANLLTTEWQNGKNLKIWQNRVWCYYFSAEPTNMNNNLTYFESSVSAVNINENTNTNVNSDTATKCINPKSLFTLCIQALQTKIIPKKNNVQSTKEIRHKSDAITDLKAIKNAEKLSYLCLHKIKHIIYNTKSNVITVPKTNKSLPDKKTYSLKMLCYHQIVKHFSNFNISRESDNTCISEKECCNPTFKKKNTSKLFTSDRKLQSDENINADNSTASLLKSRNNSTVKTVPPLQTLCYHTIIQNRFKFAIKDEKNEKLPCYKVNSLLALCLKVILCWQKNNIKCKRTNKENNKTVSKQVETLLSLSLNIIQNTQQTDVGWVKDINKLRQEKISVSIKHGHTIDNIENCNNLSMKLSNQINNKCKCVKIEHFAPKSLKQIALSYLQHIMTYSEYVDSGDLNSKIENTSYSLTNHDNCLEQFENTYEVANHLVESVQCASNSMLVKPLFHLCFEKVKLIYDSENVLIQNSGCNSIQINSVNTVPEEVFFSFHDVTSNLEDCNVNSGDEEGTYDDNLFDNCNEEETQIEDSNFESKQSLKDICSPAQNNDFNYLEHEGDSLSAEIRNTSSIAQIKLEPIENDIQENVAEIKIEPDLEHTLMPRIQCIQAAKLENFFESPNITSEVLSTFGNDFDSFKSLLSRKEMEKVIVDKSNPEQKVFSQSSLRIRRQFEPDSDDDNDNNMSLLVPNSYEPIDNEIIRNIMPNANRVLEEDGKIEKKKKKNEKRIEKKKNKSKTLVSKDIGVEELPSDDENDVIQEKLHDKKVQEEEAAESSDDSLNMVLSSRRTNKSRRSSEQELQTKSKQKSTTGEIQCNDVDSTQETNENNEPNEEENITEPDYTGLLEYNKYVNNLYVKLKNQEAPNAKKDLTDAIRNEQSHDETEDLDRPFSPAFNTDEPVELLQCEPSLPFLDDIVKNRKSSRPIKNTESLKSNVGHFISDLKTSDSNQNTFDRKYDVNNDIKLCQEAIVALEKLPENVIETYFKSQGIKKKEKCENTLERVENVLSLDQNKSKRPKIPDRSIILDDKSNDSDNSMIPFGEDSNNDNESLLELPISERLNKSTNPEDCDEMELEKLVKKEEEEENRVKEGTSDEELKYAKSLRSRKHLKETKEAKTENCDSKSYNDDNDAALLTADKVMKKDLLLLHAPVEDNQLTTNPSKYPTRNKRKSDGIAHNDEINADDYSSSEEEKQWVTTKEKLLKRLLKKQDDTSMDAAKRAKVVSEFIARCKTIETRKRYTRSGRSRRKNFLERQKQLNVLSKELFGETSNETYQLGKKSSQSFGKGRRNIRRVIDKKSLARSTLLANIEEIERKRRLLHRQNKLREILGCEEGVNVVVINDEVCLEYDFEENRPVVSVHPFFTQVMKAHQYEGVKFMWDACFESLELVGAGHPGGGCILAHCMGLGKTLQVLALLHTVLTHPGVGMQRVLVVCPLSTVLNWVDEINKWMGPVNDNIKVFELSKLKKTYERAYQLEDWYTGGGIFIMGYEMFRNLSTLDAILDNVRLTIVNKIRTALLDPGPDIIICDEGHLLKNDSSVLAVAISRITTKRRIVLTGTPMQNNLREYYCMVNFVKPNLLGLYSEYANRFENPIMNGQHRDSREEDIKLMKARTHILHKVLEGCLQRQEAAVLYPYLPKKHEYTVFIPLTKCQTDLYKHYLKHYTKETKPNLLRDYHILQKIWTHPQVLHNFQLKSRDANKVKVEKLEDDLACEDLTASEDVKPSQTEVWWLEYLEGGNMLESLESSNKLYAVFRILDECIALGDKLLIFSTSLFTMDALEYFLKKIKNWSLGHEYYRLDGSVPAEVRQNWCREFNSPNNLTTNLFLISTRAGCLGLNMTTANRVIILDTSWNPAHDIQSIFRVYRFGQKKDCYIYRLVAMGTMEQKIYERSVTKQAVACRVVDSQQIDRHYNMDELTELYKFDETGSSVESGVAAGVTDVALLRVARDAPLHAVYEHDSLLRDSHDQQLPEHERAAAWKQFEMEQGHSHMANLENNLLKTPTKKIHGHDYAMSPSLALDKTNDANTKPKGKRGRKSKQKLLKDMSNEENVEENLGKREENPSCDQFNLTTEVQQIKNILVQQNVDNDFSDINEVENLVNHVQKVVDARSKGERCYASPLVDSLAKVFLQMKGNDLATKSDQTPTTSVVDEEEHATSEENHKASKSNKRKLQIDIKTNKTIHDIEEGDSVEEIKKRKAAVKAKENINSLNLKDTKDTEDCEDENWSQEENTGTLDTRQSKGNQKDSDDKFDQAIDLRSDDEISVEDDSNADKTEKSQKTVMVEIPDDDDAPLRSIILSDDETVVEIDKSEAAKNTKDCDKLQDNENERIPLHASLLENQYFINMVAYKYMEGNPVLDKDAALHAARYSTQKALKEMQETGKELYSGPLYDIAVNSIGMVTLKQLQNVSKKSKPESDSTKQNKDSSKIEQSACQPEHNEGKGDVNKSKRVYTNKVKQKSEQTKESVSSKRQERKISTDSDDLVLVSDEVICEKPKTKKSVNTKTQESQRESLNSDANQINKILTQSSTPAPAQATSKELGTSSVSNLRIEQDLVVPIQLIKSSSNSTITMTRPTTPLTEECILPDDDDDVCYVNDTPPTASTSKNTSSSLRSGDTYPQNITAPITPTKSNVQPTIVPDKVLCLPDENPISSMDLDNELAEAIKSIDNENKNENSDTICLDSDDEDDIVGSKETQATTLSTATSSKPDPPPPNPVFISVTPTHTIAMSPTMTSKTVNSQAKISKSTIVNTTIGINKPLPIPTPSFSQLQCSTNNMSSLVNTSANGFCIPGDVIKINQYGAIYLLKPNQTSVTRLLTNPTPTTIPSTPTISTSNSKIGKIAIKALKINKPPTKPKRNSTRKATSMPRKAEQIKPSSHPQIAPQLTIIPLQATKTQAKSSVNSEKGNIGLYYPNKKVRASVSKRSNEVITDCLDLTDVDENDVKKTAANKITATNVLPHTSNTKTSNTVVGSPKDFMIVRSGDKTKLEITTSRKRKEPTMPALVPFDFKKKLTSDVAGPSKKTKITPFKKLTLHDFNIDKIDEDIIELE
ncbi:uncharacterized protein LOC106716733 [Papilio machaon]|uniref:uncharacterized protein LOC106716733 n=1 Tax=Papilio machaon TaxID=76193 RepID=UPI001E6658EB|nr:uncharacterized protein LOC106716733 [Papilio machaon]